MTAERVFTMAELAQCNTPDNCCVAIRGQVYDVTKFLSSHPGGWDMLYLNGGKDATALFEAYHPDWVASKRLNPMLVGRLESSEYPTFPESSKFYQTLKQRVRQHFDDRHMRATDAKQMIFRAVLLVVFSFVFWYLCVNALQSSSSFARPLAFICAGVVGFCSALISLMPVHEASHGASTSSPWFWRISGALHDWINGASYFTWIHQHLLGHHPFTHIEELDPDIVTGDPDARRIKKSQRLFSIYQYQHIYMPLLYGLLAPKFRINDIVMFFSANPKNGEIRMNKPGPWHTFNFIGGKLFFFTWRFLIPGFFVGYWNMFLMCFFADLVTSYYLAFVFQPSHVVSEAEMIELGSDKHIEMDWAEMQVRTTIDYGHGSWLTTFLTGGLNYQVAHHLFPGVCQLHYPQITPIILDTCKEFNVPYVVVPTYWDALLCHFRYLYRMGNPEAAPKTKAA
jgi:fatty acid desaturase/predicted heme/steroid binding protein